MGPLVNYFTTTKDTLTFDHPKEFHTCNPTWSFKCPCDLRHLLHFTVVKTGPKRHSLTGLTIRFRKYQSQMMAVGIQKRQESLPSGHLSTNVPGLSGWSSLSGLQILIFHNKPICLAWLWDGFLLRLQRLMSYVYGLLSACRHFSSEGHLSCPKLPLSTLLLEQGRFCLTFLSWWFIGSKVVWF